jgi:hypothetical protein
MAAVAAAALVVGGSLAYSAGAAAAPHPRIPKLSHQLCYNATAKGFKIPATVTLYDRLSPHGFKPKIIAAVLHCNPVTKTVISATGGRTVYPITNAAAHLACFTIKEAKQPTPVVFVANQFGAGGLIPAQPTMLCLPSWKSLTGPPKMKAPQPPGLDHFVCYPVTATHAKFAVPSLTLQDEFAAKPVTTRVGSAPGLLCLPAKKVIAGAAFGILHPNGSLVCFPVLKTPIRTPVYDQNQFGTATVTITKVRWLCLPSKVTAVG